MLFSKTSPFSMPFRFLSGFMGSTASENKFIIVSLLSTTSRENYPKFPSRIECMFKRLFLEIVCLKMVFKSLRHFTKVTRNRTKNFFSVVKQYFTKICIYCKKKRKLPKIKFSLFLFILLFWDINQNPLF